MIGPNFSFPFAKIAIDLRVEVGSVSTTVPELTYEISNDALTATSILKEADGSAFGYSLGIGSRFNLSHNWALRVAGNFISAEPEIETLMTDTFTILDESAS